jgi:tetratricopeptide (TPR) repeat protein
MGEILAKGDLRSRPLAHLLVHALDRKLVGELFLAVPGGRTYVVQLLRGGPVKARPDQDETRTGELLVRRGLVSELDVGEALAEEGPLGDALIRRGRIDRELLRAVLEEQFAERMLRLFALPETTTFALRSGLVELSRWGYEAAVDPLALLWSGLRQHGHHSSHYVSMLEDLEHHPLSLHPRAVLDRFQLGLEEEAIIEALTRAPLLLRELIGLGVASEDLVRRLVYLLAITRYLDSGSSQLPVGLEQGGVAPVGRVALKPAAHRFGAAAPDPPGAGGEERGTVPRPRRSRPDWPAATERTTPTEGATSSDRLSPMGPSTPRARESSPGAPPETPTSPSLQRTRKNEAASDVAENTTLGPFMLLVLAEERLGAGDYGSALIACERARRAAPTDARVLSERLRLMAQLPGANLPHLREELDALALCHPEEAQVFYVRGVVRQKAGDQSGAAADLGRALELDPSHDQAGEALGALRR